MCSAPLPDTVATLMDQFRRGDKAAANQLVEVLYPELRRLAAAKMKGERREHTWQPTLLVNELYLALIKIKGLDISGVPSGQEKAAFLGLAGHIMKRLLIEHSRRLYRRAEKVQFRDWSEFAATGTESLHEVEEALSRLAGIDPKFRAVVEMKVFEGLTADEIAAQLDCSPRTVATYWTFSKCWLERELADSPPA